jgi:hypothetical protein
MVMATALFDWPFIDRFTIRVGCEGKAAGDRDQSQNNANQ